MHASEPDLPPPFRAVALREGADALTEAVRRASTGGAGTLCWVRSAARAEAALVLEPDRPLGAARLALPLAASALVDALGGFGPPEVPIGYRWPGTLLVNGGVCGTLALRAPDGCDPAAVPDWLVVGYELRMLFPEGWEPGLDPGRTSLREEGFHDLTPAELVGSWARHLLAGFDAWSAAGPRKVAEPFLARLLDPPAENGVRRGLDPATGALILERPGAAPERLDPA